MRGSLVVLALAVTPFIAQAQNRPHWQRHDKPAAAKSDDKKCDERQRGNPSEVGRQNRADPRSKGNKGCDLSGQNGGGDTPPPPPVVQQFGHTQIDGSVFFDVDQDGFLGVDEVGLSGWTVQASGPMFVSTVSGANGAYTLAGLTAGVYTICVVPPMGWTQTSPSAGTGPTCASATVGISIEAPELVGDVGYAGVDFGFISNP